MDTALWVAIITSALAGIGWLFKNEKEKRHDVEKQLSEKKYEVYIAAIELFAYWVNCSRLNIAPDLNETADRVISISKELIIYGSDPVLKKFSFYRQNVSPQEPIKALKLYYDVMIEIRRDMGHRKTIANEDDLLGMFISDYKELRDQIIAMR